MRWPEQRFEPECSFDVDGDDTRTAVYFDSSMYNFYRTLTALRSEHLALQAGTQQTLLIDDVAGLYAFQRSSGADKIYVVVNAGDNSSECTLSYVGLPDGLRVEDPVSHMHFFAQNDRISFVMPPRTVTVLVPAAY
jgi:glycosidase